MRSVLKAEQIRTAEKAAEKSGITEMFLRQNAALAIADGITARAKSEYAKTAVFCGAGGNGYGRFARGYKTA